MTERWWSAGGGVGWPMREVIDGLKRIGRIGEDTRQSVVWPWRSHLPLYINRPPKPDPVVLTADPLTWDLAFFAGAEPVLIHTLCGPPREPKPGEADDYSDLRWPT